MTGDSSNNTIKEEIPYQGEENKNLNQIPNQNVATEVKDHKSPKP